MTGPVVTVEVPTVHGPARARVHPATAGHPAHPGHRPGTLLLGHGAGGLGDAADLSALRRLTGHGWTLVLVDQPWRVAGRRVATAPPSLDRAWLAVLDRLAGSTDPLLPAPWVVGGRSAGARVACRTATGGPSVAGVLCLAFPLHPPGRPERSRAAELAVPVATGIPTLVLQGRTDPFGTPEEVAAAVAGPGLRLRSVPGGHSPSRDLDAVVGHALDFLAALA